MASSITPACARVRRASVSRCSLRSGLRLWGMVMLPTTAECWPSASSPISARCSSITSLPIRARVPVTSASSKACSTRRSRLVSQLIPGSASPSRRQSSARSGGPWSPKNPSVPTAPPSWPTSQRPRPSCIRSRCRPTSSAHDATFQPNVTGAPGCAWVRPTMIVDRCARESSISRRPERPQVPPDDGHDPLSRQHRPGVREVLHGDPVVDVLGRLGRERGLQGGDQARASSGRCAGSLATSRSRSSRSARAHSAIVAAAAAGMMPSFGLRAGQGDEDLDPALQAGVLVEDGPHLVGPPEVRVLPRCRSGGRPCRHRRPGEGAEPRRAPGRARRPTGRRRSDRCRPRRVRSRCGPRAGSTSSAARPWVRSAARVRGTRRRSGHRRRSTSGGSPATGHSRARNHGRRSGRWSRYQVAAPSMATPEPRQGRSTSTPGGASASRSTRSGTSTMGGRSSARSSTRRAWSSSFAGSGRHHLQHVDDDRLGVEQEAHVVVAALDDHAARRAVLTRDPGELEGTPVSISGRRT